MGIDKMVTPHFVYSYTNFNKSWEHILKDIVLHGNNITFGDMSELKNAREIHMTLQLYGDAIKQTLNCDVHPMYPIRGQALLDHVADYQVSQSELKQQVNPETGYAYTYQFQLRNYGIDCDQLENMRNKIIEEQKHPTLASNRLFAMVNDVKFLNNKNPPCLQSVYVRRLQGNEYAVRYIFRSHDIFGGLLSNNPALTNCLNEFVFKPSNTRIAEITFDSLSAHVYETDSQIVEQITGLDWDTRKPKNKTSRTTIHSIHQSALNKTLDKISERCEEMKKYV